MNIKKSIAIIICLILVVDAVVYFTMVTHSQANNSTSDYIYQSAAVKSVDASIVVDGTITAQDTADLHFQTGGKLVSLPYKEGDTVSEGATIAQLDTYQLQEELSSALNNYTATRDQFDQSQVNQANGVTQKVQAGQDNFYGAGLSQYGTDPDTTNYLNDIAKRIVDENQADLNNSVINVQIANYALQMATLTSPINGVITHEDVTVSGENVTPETTFTVADPSTKVFRANIPTSDIDFVSLGMNASIMLDGVKNQINGTITNVYPSTVTLADGENVYQVDIASDDVKNLGKLNQGGSAIIMTNAQNVILVPAWTVVGNQYIWVDNNGTPQLKKITTGGIHGSDIEVTHGLTKDDRIITDPKVIPSREYPIL